MRHLPVEHLHSERSLALCKSGFSFLLLIRTLAMDLNLCLLCAFFLTSMLFGIHCLVDFTIGFPSSETYALHTLLIMKFLHLISTAILSDFFFQRENLLHRMLYTRFCNSKVRNLAPSLTARSLHLIGKCLATFYFRPS